MGSFTKPVRQPRVCFFAKVRDRRVLRNVEFYAQDIDALQSLGCEVDIVTTWSALRPADLYFVWWWTWAAAPVAMAKLLRRPVVITGTFDLWAFPDRPRLHRALLRYALREADGNIFVSEMEQREVSGSFPVSSPSYSPHCVDTERYRPGEETRQSGQLLTVAGMHGTNAERKGVPEAIATCAALRQRGHDVDLTIVGEKGTGFPALSALAAELGVEAHVHFPGLLSAEEKTRLMQRCTLYLQPSRFEGFGLSMLEAMSCGAPVLARPGGAIPEVLGDAGVLVTQAGEDAFSAEAEVLLADAQKRAQLSALARTRAVTLFPLARRRADLVRVLAPLLASRGLELA